jgi:6-pyruvoyltetrahydropterin/6-carboxytetrahydropterin synthase
MRLRVEDVFDAATALPGHDRCAGLHGHTYKVELVVAGRPDAHGVLTDFRELRRRLREAIQPYDHADLSALFSYPSCETLCLELARKLARTLPGLELVRVWEGEGKWVELDARDLEALKS